MNRKLLVSSILVILLSIPIFTFGQSAGKTYSTALIFMKCGFNGQVPNPDLTSAIYIDTGDGKMQKDVNIPSIAKFITDMSAKGWHLHLF